MLSVESDRKQHNRGALFATGIVLGLVVISTLLLEYVPLVDLPNHLARIYALATYDQIPLMEQHYTLEWRLIPNSTVDVLLLPVVRMWGVQWGARLLVSAITVVWALGCWQVGGAFGMRFSWWTGAAGLSALNGALQYGFVSYSLGAGVALISFAHYVRCREAPASGRALLGLLFLSVVTYLTHLAAFGVLGLMCGGVWLYRSYERREVSFDRALAVVALPLLLGVAYAVGGAHSGALEFSTVKQKAISAFSVMRGYHLSIDIASVCIVAIALGTVTANWLKLRRTLSELYTVALVLALAWLILPRDLLGASGLDARIPPFILALLLIGAPSTTSSNSSARIGVLVFSVFAFRSLLICWDWRELSRDVAISVSVTEKAAVGSAMFSVIDELSDPDESKRLRVLEHAIFYAVPTRHAEVAKAFAIPGQNIVLARRWRYLDVDPNNLLRDDVKSFQYIVAQGIGAATRVSETKCCTLAEKSGKTWLFRTER